MNDTVSTQICEPHNQPSENRSGLSQLFDTRICDIRPVSAQGFTRVSFIGSRTFAIRTPEIGEVGLSQSEIDYAIDNAIYM